MKDSSGKKKDKVIKEKIVKEKTIKQKIAKTSPGGTKEHSLRDKIFKIKIADLLNETGREDQIVFDHKFSDQLLNLNDEGITGTFVIQSLDTNSLLGTLTDVTARFHEICDSCRASFLRSVDIPLYTARFVFEDEAIKEKELAESEEVVFHIDPKAETINIEDMVVQSIFLNDPFVKRCDACTKRLESVDDEEDLGEFESKGNIIFS